MRLVATALCSLVLGCAPGGPTLTVYHRTSPRRVEVDKRSSPSSLFALALRRDLDRVEVHLKRESRVALRRVLHYNAEALVYEPSENAAIEALEMWTGFLVLLDPGLWGIQARLDGNDTSTRKLVRHHSALRALFDPTISALGNNIREVPLVNEPIFSDPPVVREYQIRVPAPGVTVAFRVMDETRRELARGSRTTDAYGEMEIVVPLAHAVVVELAADGVAIAVPVQRTAPAGGEEPVAASRAIAGPPLSNEGWARWRDDTDRLPRVSLMLDVAGLPSREIKLFGEVRLGRRWSFGGSLARERFSRDRAPATSATLIHDVGGALRLYPFGHMGTGFHLGLEAATGFTDSLARHSTLDVAAYGMTFGYKHTFDVGLTIDLWASEGVVKLDDPATQGADGWSWWPRFHANLGWSF